MPHQGWLRAPRCLHCNTPHNSRLFTLWSNALKQMMVNECLQLRSTGIVVWETDFQPTSQLQTPSTLSPSHTYNFSSRNVGPGLGVRAMYKLCDDMMLSCPAQQFECVLVFSLKQVQRDRLLGMRYVKANQLIACLDPWHDLFLTLLLQFSANSICKFQELCKLCLELFCYRSKLRGRTGLWGACEGHLGWKRRQQTNGTATALMKNDHVRTSHLEVY